MPPQCKMGSGSKRKTQFLVANFIPVAIRFEMSSAQKKKKNQKHFFVILRQFDLLLFANKFPILLLLRQHEFLEVTMVTTNPQEGFHYARTGSLMFFWRPCQQTMEGLWKRISVTSSVEPLQLKLSNRINFAEDFI